MNLEEQINQEIKQAMLAKHEAGLRALRAIKSALLLAKTEDGAAGMITAEKELQVLNKLAKQRRESIDIYTTQNRADLAVGEQDELAVIEKFLPKQLTAEELSAEIKAIIASTGAVSAKDMGKVMGVASKQLAGKADGKAISELVKQLLN